MIFAMDRKGDPLRKSKKKENLKVFEMFLLYVLKKVI